MTRDVCLKITFISGAHFYLSESSPKHPEIINTIKAQPPPQIINTINSVFAACKFSVYRAQKMNFSLCLVQYSWACSYKRSCFDQKCKLWVLLTFIPRLQSAEQVPSILQKAQGDPKLDVQQHCSILTSHRLAGSETMKGRREEMGEANKTGESGPWASLLKGLYSW